MNITDNGRNYLASYKNKTFPRMMEKSKTENLIILWLYNIGHLHIYCSIQNLHLQVPGQTIDAGNYCREHEGESQKKKKEKKETKPEISCS